MWSRTAAAQENSIFVWKGSSQSSSFLTEVAKTYLKKSSLLLFAFELDRFCHDFRFIVSNQPFVGADRRPSVRTAFNHGCWEQMLKRESSATGLKTRAAETHATKFRTRATTTIPKQITSTAGATYFTSCKSLFVCASTILSVSSKVDHLTI